MSEEYAWPDAATWVRAVMLMALDGAIAGTDGRSGSLSNAEDRGVLAAVRAGADAVLIGAATFRAERYRPMRAREPLRSERLARGLQPSPRLVIVSGSLELPWAEPAFADSEQTPLVITNATHAPATIAEAATHCEVVALPEISGASILAALTERGLHRIACEGGRVLLGLLVEAGLVDEWCLTVAPIAGASRYELAEQRASADYLYLRYVQGGRA